MAKKNDLALQTIPPLVSGISDYHWRYLPMMLDQKVTQVSSRSLYSFLPHVMRKNKRRSVRSPLPVSELHIRVRAQQEDNIKVGPRNVINHREEGKLPLQVSGSRGQISSGDSDNPSGGARRGTARLPAIILRKQRGKDLRRTRRRMPRWGAILVGAPARGRGSIGLDQRTRSFSTARVSDLSVRAANDISVFPSNLAALRAILKQFYTSRSVGSGCSRPEEGALSAGGR